MYTNYNVLYWHFFIIQFRHFGIDSIVLFSYSCTSHDCDNMFNFHPNCKSYHARHTCSKKGGWGKKVKSHIWGKKVKSHICRCMTSKIDNYVLYDAEKLETQKLKFFNVKNANFVLHKFSAFSTFLSKMAKFESTFIEKYKFLNNCQWFRQPNIYWI